MEKNKTGLGKYKEGKIGSYYLTNTIVPAWEEQVKGNAVSDIDITSDGKHIAYIVSNNKTGLNKSFLYIINEQVQ